MTSKDLDDIHDHIANIAQALAEEGPDTPGRAAFERLGHFCMLLRTKSRLAAKADAVSLGRETETDARF